jgi:hypothetical protein
VGGSGSGKAVGLRPSAHVVEVQYGVEEEPIGRRGLGRGGARRVQLCTIEAQVLIMCLQVLCVWCGGLSPWGRGHVGRLCRRRGRVDVCGDR